MNTTSFWNMKGWVRTTFFVIFCLIYRFIFHDYVVRESDKFMDDRHWGENPLFGLLLFVIFVFETVALFLGIKHLSFLKYQSLEKNLGKKGCSVRFNEAIIGIGVYFHLIYVVFLELIIQNSTASILGLLTILILFVREFYFMFKLWGILYDDTIEKKEKKPLSKQQLIFCGLVLNISSVVFFSISWDVLLTKIGGSMVAAFFLSFILYLPIRIFFVLDDYLSINDVKSRRYAFLSSAFVIFMAVISAVL